MARMAHQKHFILCNQDIIGHFARVPSLSALDAQPRTGIPRGGRGGLALVTLWCYFVHTRVQYSVHGLASLGWMGRTPTEVHVGRQTESGRVRV